MAEQAVNTIYGLGDQPDALCSEILREMTAKVFGPRSAPAVADDEDLPMDATEDAGAGVQEGDEGAEADPTSASQTASQSQSQRADSQDPTLGNSFELSQLIFVAGHCAIKQLVHLELIERDIKRRKAVEDKKSGGKATGQDELDQVAGSVEDDIGDVIAHTKEKELLYGPDSLLAIFGPMAATIVSQPKVYRVRPCCFVMEFACDDG